jgi:hypothetical protein
MVTASVAETFVIEKAISFYAGSAKGALKNGKAAAERF